MNIHDAIRSRYGSNADITLAIYGISAADICGKYQALYDSGAYANPMFAGTPEEAAITDAYNELRKTVLNNWLSRVPRDAMIGTLTSLVALGDLATVSYLPDESLSYLSLMDAWNKANPDKTPISINPGLLP